MTFPTYWYQACDELSNRDPVLKQIIDNYKGEFLVTRGDAFYTLLRSIVGQQISVKAAESIWNKLVSTIKKVTPKAVLDCDKKRLKLAGLSERKVEYIIDLATHFQSKKIDPKSWDHKNDQQIIEELVAIRGIGVWSAEMFLIFYLMRPNVFPKKDLGLQKAIAINYKKRYPLSENQLNLFKKRYAPWSSVATWYLWRSLDPVPVKY